MKFCERLESLLEDWDLTQRQLAEDLHIASTTLNGYIRGKREPDYGTLIRIAAYFNVSTDYLLGITNNKANFEKALDVREDNLVGIYRNLQPEHKDLLLEQAHFYQRVDAKRRGERRHQKK